MKACRPSRIALVEGDAIVAAAILATLRGAGHACRRFASGATALRELENGGFDLLLVERLLPDMAAAELMTGVRARLGYTLPVIGLASHADDIAAALDEGVDDCLARPVPPRLLLPQVNAAVRRAAPGSGRIEAAIGHLTFEPEGTKVHIDGKTVSLTAKEYALSLLLCRNLGRVLGREHLLRVIWGDDIAQLSRTLDVHVSRLRSKLDLRPVRGFRLAALYGRGYRLDYAAPAAPLSPRRPASPSAPALAEHRP